ncbi:hypothetical protein CsSME_00036798 [Camellia sinensis var. sinensis]
MWRWQCHQTQRQMILHVGKCTAILSPNAAGSIDLLVQSSFIWHDAKLTNRAVYSSYACKKS